MDDTMRDLASLKRPVLQKLCKKFGIKANGKNVDMIKALKELRDSTGLILHNIENIPCSKPSQPEASLTLLDMPSPDTDKMNPSSRKCKKGGKGRRKKRDASRKISNQHSLSLSTSSSGDTPLSLSDVSNKPCAWLTTSAESFNLSESHNHECSCDESVQKSPPHGRKRRYSETSNPSPERPAPVTKHARYESPHQLYESLQNVGSDPMCNEQPCKAPYSPPLAPISPQPPISPPPQAPFSPPSAQPPIPPPHAPISLTQAPFSCPQAPFSPLQPPISPLQALFSPPQPPISPPQAPFSPPQAPFSPPFTSEDFKSNSKRKRNSTYTLGENDCDEHNATKDEGEEPPSKRVRRATFNISPKIANKIENEINKTNENISCNVEVNDTQVLSGIADVHSEIMDLLDKRVEKIRADSSYKPVFSASESFSSKVSLKASTTIAKKFDSAHKKQFSRMQSIVSYQCDKERRHATVRKGSTPHTGKTPRPTEKQMSKIPKAHTTATRPKSVSTFKPSTLNVKRASFNFAVNDATATATATKAPKLGSRPVVMSVNEASLGACENRVKKSTAISKNPGKNGGITPSKFAAKASCTSTKKLQPQLDVTKSLNKKPTYKPHKGKLPDFQISRY